jgi:hypothetical protein
MRLHGFDLNDDLGPFNLFSLRTTQRREFEERLAIIRSLAQADYVQDGEQEKATDLLRSAIRAGSISTLVYAVEMLNHSIKGRPQFVREALRGNQIEMLAVLMDYGAHIDRRHDVLKSPKTYHLYPSVGYSLQFEADHFLLRYGDTKTKDDQGVQEGMWYTFWEAAAEHCKIQISFPQIESTLFHMLLHGVNPHEELQSPTTWYHNPTHVIWYNIPQARPADLARFLSYGDNNSGANLSNENFERWKARVDYCDNLRVSDCLTSWNSSRGSDSLQWIRPFREQPPDWSDSSDSESEEEDWDEHDDEDGDEDGDEAEDRKRDPHMGVLYFRERLIRTCTVEPHDYEARIRKILEDIRNQRDDGPPISQYYPPRKGLSGTDVMFETFSRFDENIATEAGARQMCRFPIVRALCNALQMSGYRADMDEEGDIWYEVDDGDRYWDARETQPASEPDTVGNCPVCQDFEKYGLGEIDRRLESGLKQMKEEQEKLKRRAAWDW